MITTIDAYEVQCDKCGYNWRSYSIPLRCAQQKCRTVAWNENSIDVSDIYADISTGVYIDVKKDSIDGEFSKKEKISALKDLMNSAGSISSTSQEPAEERWQFTKDSPQYADDGSVYRLQKLAPEFKNSRTVRVDPFDHEKLV